MKNIIKVLQERGFIEKKTHEKELIEIFGEGPVTCYVGFDPTAASLHIGSLVPIMSLAHMQTHGHRPIALIGGGTGLVGDPSGKTEMRKLLTMEAVQKNILGIKKQLSNFIDFNNGKALLLNNAQWLTKLEYIPFIRDIGRYFSVNRMIKAESYKMRLESEEGLSFVEFNYMLLQAYDFLELFDSYGCKLQMGGSDQWGNIVAGIDLVRRTRQKTVCGITFPLITTSSGAKMGKTAKGAVWLDPIKTTPYEYYQYWINTDDRDVARFLALFSFLPMDEIATIENLKDADLNTAKTVLAFETTRLAHGREKAIKAYHAASSMFGLRIVPREILPSSSIPRDGKDLNDNLEQRLPDHQKSVVNAPLPDLRISASGTEVPRSDIDLNALKKGIPAFEIFHQVGLANSKSAARRLIEQGGAYINNNRIQEFDSLITDDHIKKDEILLRSGKKRFHILKVEM